MDLQATYDYLMRIRKTEYAIKRKQLRCEELRSCLLPGAIRYDLDKVQTSPRDKIPEIMAKVDELEHQIEVLMQEKAMLIIEIGEAIEQLPDDNEKTVLTEFYIGRVSMEKVAALINYSPRRAYKRKKYAQFQHHKLEPWKDETTGESLGFQYVIENSVVLCTSGAGRELTPEEWNQIPHFEGLAARVETGSDQPQFVIDKLNIANNVDEDDSNPMGISLFANSVDVLAKLDLEYDSYANEFSLGRKRIFVSPEMLTNVDGAPVFDPHDSVFYQLPEDYFKDTKEAMHEVNPTLRIQEHEQAINNDLNLLSFKCGFGTQYYRFEKGNITTATQVISENSDMYRTIRKHEIILGDALTDLIRCIIRLGQTANVPGLVLETDITIDFDDSIIEDKQTERQEDRQDVAMGAMSLQEYRAKWYGETEEVAEQKLPDQSGGILM